MQMFYYNLDESSLNLDDQSDWAEVIGQKKQKSTGAWPGGRQDTARERQRIRRVRGKAGAVARAEEERCSR